MTLYFLLLTGHTATVVIHPLYGRSVCLFAQYYFECGIEHDDHKHHHQQHDNNYHDNGSTTRGTFRPRLHGPESGLWSGGSNRRGGPVHHR